MGKKKNKSKVEGVAEYKKQADLPKKIEPPVIESAPVKAWTNENGEQKWILDHKICANSHPLNHVTGVKDSELAANIVLPAAQAISSNNGREWSLNTVIQSLHDFKPLDAVEARLVVQATVAFSHAMSLTQKGTNSDMLCHLEPLTNLAIKFMRVHNETIDAISRYRRGGEQKVTVTHVAEKMAVVNNYGCQGGGGIPENKGDNPCSSQNAEQKPEQTIIDHVDSQQWPMEDAASTEENVQVQRPKKVESE
jgi:hypothetical protein